MDRIDDEVEKAKAKDVWEKIQPKLDAINLKTLKGTASVLKAILKKHPIKNAEGYNLTKQKLE